MCNCKGTICYSSYKCKSFVKLAPASSQLDRSVGWAPVQHQYHWGLCSIQVWIFSFLVCCYFLCCCSSFQLNVVKQKPKVVTLTNHNRLKKSHEPIRIRSKYKQLAPSAVKCMWANREWFWLWFSLVKKMWPVLLTNPEQSNYKTKVDIKLLSIQLKTALLLLLFHLSWTTHQAALSLPVNLHPLVIFCCHLAI